MLLDRRLPDHSSDAVRVMRREWGLDARVALVTAKQPETAIVDLGFDDYVLKPVDQTTLTSTVHHLARTPAYDAIWRELSTLRVKRNGLEAALSADQ